MNYLSNNTCTSATLPGRKKITRSTYFACHLVGHGLVCNNRTEAGKSYKQKMITLNYLICNHKYPVFVVK